MYNNRLRNIELPENLFSNLGEIKSKKTTKSPTTNLDDIPNEASDVLASSDYQVELDSNVKLTNYSSRKEYRDRIDKMYEEIKGIIPVDSDIDPILYFNNYVEKGIVVKPKVPSLKQFWTEYRLISNEKNQTSTSLRPSVSQRTDVELDSFDKLFEALSARVSEINSYIDELKEMKISIDKTAKKLEEDKAKFANERSEFNTYKQKEETKLNKEKENLKVNFNRLQTIIDDLDKKLISIDTEE